MLPEIVLLFDSGNTANGNDYGLYIYDSSHNEIFGNTANSNQEIGIVLGVLCMTAAFLSPWIANAISPPKPVEEEIVDFATRIKDAAIAKAKGEKFAPRNPKEENIADYVPPAVIALSMVAMALGIVSIVKEEKKLIGSTAVCLGVSAAVVQWSIVIAVAVIFIIVVFCVLSAMGIQL